MHVIRDKDRKSVTLRVKFIESIRRNSKTEGVIRMVSGIEHVVDSHELFLIERQIKG